MKKSLSLILSALMTASAMTACAPARDRLDPAITLASSDAQTKAAWLDERLDVIPDDVVLGIGSNTAYGIDMSAFENDGYIARAIGDEVLLFGKTVDGLDRAVREYAKSADKGTTAELDTVYHEGVRVEKLTIAGTDISEYTVVYTYDRDYTLSSANQKTIGNAKFAAEEFVRLVAAATGVTLPTEIEDVTTPMIKIDYITDGSHDENGFTYEVKDGNLYINGAPDANGCANGVYYFLEYECGWDALMFGDSDLQEAELVDVPEGASASIDPIFDFVDMYYTFRYPYRNDRPSWAQNYEGVIGKACHGMPANDWSGKGDNTLVIICYTDKSNYANTVDKVYTYVKNAVDSGKVIGETITTIDISQADSLFYCMCKTCSKVYKEEGRAHSGAVLRFANRLAADMEAEGFGGLAYQIFAYHGSNKPCITEARDDVFVTLCNDGSCQNHPLDGSECTGISFDMAGVIPGMEELNNIDYADWMKGWGEICDNVYLWHYALTNNYGQYTYFDIIYDDIMFMKESNLKGLFLEQEYYGTGLGRLRMQLMNFLIYNPDVTEAEYEVVRNEIMKREYGDGWDFVLDFIGILRETEVNTGCWNCWGYGNIFNTSTYDIELFYSRVNEMLGLLEKAIAQTSTVYQEQLVRALYAEMLYRQCAIGYFKAYDEGDTETITYLEEQYAKFVTNMYFTGLADAKSERMTCFLGNPGMPFIKVLEDAAWIQWKDYRDDLTFGDREQKPMPDKWIEYYETSETSE